MKLKFVLLILLISFFTISDAGAEKIRLKNGLFFNGQIQESNNETITIKPKFGSVATYKWDEIETIDEKSIDVYRQQSPVAPQATTEKEPQVKKENEEIQKPEAIDDKVEAVGDVVTAPMSNPAWDNWRTKTRDYYMGVETIVETANANFQDLRLQGITATDEAQIISAIKTFRDVLGQQIGAIKELEPPQELKLYHQSLVSHLEFMDKSQEELLAGNIEAANKFLQLSRESYIEAKHKLRETFKNEGAPEDLLKEMDAVLSEYDTDVESNNG